MGYTKGALEDKIFEMYPEINSQGISLSIGFDDDKNAYVLKFKKNMHELITYLEKTDADECMEGVKCVHLGVQDSQFIRNFES